MQSFRDALDGSSFRQMLILCVANMERASLRVRRGKILEEDRGGGEGRTESDQNGQMNVSIHRHYPLQLLAHLCRVGQGDGSLGQTRLVPDLWDGIGG